MQNLLILEYRSVGEPLQPDITFFLSVDQVSETRAPYFTTLQFFVHRFFTEFRHRFRYLCFFSYSFRNKCPSFSEMIYQFAYSFVNIYLFIYYCLITLVSLWFLVSKGKVCGASFFPLTFFFFLLSFFFFLFCFSFFYIATCDEFLPPRNHESNPITLTELKCYQQIQRQLQIGECNRPPQGEHFFFLSVQVRRTGARETHCKKLRGRLRENHFS